MKSYRYYELENEKRLNKIKSENSKFRSPELIKYFIGNEEESLDALLEHIIEINKISHIKNKVDEYKLSNHPMYVDLVL